MVRSVASHILVDILRNCIQKVPAMSSQKIVRELPRFESQMFLHVAKIRDKVVAAYPFRHKQAGVWSKRFSRSH